MHSSFSSNIEKQLCIKYCHKDGIKYKLAYKELASIGPGGLVETLNGDPMTAVFELAFIHNIWSLLAMFRYNVVHREA